MNQHALPGGKLGMLEERLPCGEASDGDRCRLHIIKGAWLGRELVRSGEAIFGVGALAIPIVHPIDRHADSDRVGCIS